MPYTCKHCGVTFAVTGKLALAQVARGITGYCATTAKS